jgi:hypothetical protein
LEENNDDKSEAFHQQQDQSSITTLIGRGSDYIRARLERDGSIMRNCG